MQKKKSCCDNLNQSTQTQIPQRQAGLKNKSFNELKFPKSIQTSGDRDWQRKEGKN